MVTVQHGGHSPISTLLPYTGWLFALALLIWIAKQFFGSFFTNLGTRFATLFLSLFGSRALSGHALKRYRRAILKNYGEHAMGFQRGGIVNVKQVYVPLQYDDHGHRQDVAEAINSADRMVVVGEPGAGKSLLMKHILVTWADVSAREQQKIPVLVELHRCNAVDVPLVGLIRDELERNGVHGIEDGVVQRALADGKLFILFDGLDEVTRENQTRVVNLIKDFAAKWEFCKCATTCRIAVYTGQLSPQFPSTVAITEFDDADIRRLLAKWPSLDAAEADRFFAGLAESPQLIRLAGSPLLLTMMVYLNSEVFAKSGRTLPNSRKAFYEIAVNHLLSRDRELARDDALSIYEGADKRVALQRVALTLQQIPPDQPDRRAIDRIQLINTVKQVATNLNLREQDVVPLIKEIVDRSQLLVPLDRQSSRYVFRHLTLQEFLAASELRNNPMLLMQGYRTEPDGWRETLRLWCGVTSLDCTAVVKEIFRGSAQEKILALQCIPEAANIEPGFAEEVVTYFIDVVGSGAPNHAIESALGAVASEDRPRGQSVLARLQEVFTSGGPGSAGAARALAATRRSAAAHTLGERILTDGTARDALQTMGEQAIPVFQEIATKGDLRSVDDLGQIATASAASALITLITDESDVAFRAAWWIAALLRRPEVEDGLRIGKPTVPAGAPLLNWVWQPFADDDHALNASMGRVAWLLGHDAADHPPASLPAIDHRLGIAVMISDYVDELSPAASEAPQDYHQRRMGRYEARSEVIRVLANNGASNPNYVNPGETLWDLNMRDHSAAEAAIATILTQFGIPQKERRIFVHLPTEVQCTMVGDGDMAAWHYRHPTVRQWTESTAKVKEPILLRGALLTIVVITFLAAIGAATYRAFSPWFGATVGGPGWLNVSTRFALGVVVCAALVFWFSEIIFTSETSLIGKIIDVSDFLERFPGAKWLALASLLVCCTTAAATLHDHTGWDVAAATVCSVIMVTLALMLFVYLRNKRVQNPFRRYVSLNPQELRQYLLKRNIVSSGLRSSS